MSINNLYLFHLCVVKLVINTNITNHSCFMQFIQHYLTRLTYQNNIVSRNSLNTI